MSLTITDLDFDSILDNFKNYLKSQESFKDYNFEGSAINQLLKLLSYNTFYNSFYTNHIANEMFLDTASERESVVSRAKALGYTPASYSSSRAYIDVEAKINKVIGETPPTSNSYVSILPYAIFTSSVQDNDYNFITPEINNLYYKEEGDTYWVYEKKNILIKEGKILTYAWSVENDYEKFIIPNKNVDVDTLVVKVKETKNSTTSTTYTKASSLVDINENSTVYWIYETEDEKFYLEFGNDILGKRVNIGNYIEISYITTNGEEANGCKTFEAGNYYFSNNSIIETESLTITNSNYVILGLENTASEFDTNSLVRGGTSNSTAYVYDYSNNVLKLYNSSDNFIVGEIITEETTFSGNTIFGANSTVLSIKSEISSSTGGSDIENIDSIKFYAPKLYSSQDRLVTKFDYESIIKSNYPYIESVNCWGGEEETPEQLGEIFISVKPKTRDFLDTWEKEYLKSNILEPKKMIGMNINILDADYIFIYPTININYDSNLGADTTRESIESSVRENLTNYCTSNCNKFDNNFYYSKFVSLIDEANEYIINNITSIQLYKNFIPNIAIPYTSNNNISILFKNEIDSSDCSTNINSTTFTCNVASTNYELCHFSFDSSNNQTLTVANNTATVIDNAGEIDFSNGIIYISNVNIVSTDLVDSSNNEIISIYCKPLNNDLEAGGKNQILKLSPSYTLYSTPIRL